MQAYYPRSFSSIQPAMRSLCYFVFTRLFSPSFHHYPFMLSIAYVFFSLFIIFNLKVHAKAMLVNERMCVWYGRWLAKQKHGKSYATISGRFYQIFAKTLSGILKRNVVSLSAFICRNDANNRTEVDCLFFTFVILISAKQKRQSRTAHTRRMAARWHGWRIVRSW